MRVIFGELNISSLNASSQRSFLVLCVFRGTAPLECAFIKFIPHSVHEKVPDKFFCPYVYNPCELRNPNLPSKNSNTGPTCKISVLVFQTKQTRCDPSAICSVI